MDLREQIRGAPMRALQWIIVVICFLIATVEGYEIIVMAFVAPTLARAWELDSVAIGYLLSSSIFGTAIGAVFLAPVADRIGRRRFIILCGALSGIGMAVSGLATSVPTMVFARTFTGLWLGAIVPALNTLVSEYSSDRRRGTVMGIYGMGLPSGGLIGGFATGLMISQWGWQGPFFVSAVFSGMLTVATYFLIPESVEYLIDRRPRNALRDYNKVAARLGYEKADQLPEPRGQAAEKGILRNVFTGILLKRTILLWSAYGLLMAAFYFVSTWTPQLVASGTGDAASGRMAGVLLGLGAVIGTFSFAMLSARWKPRLVLILLLVAAMPIYLAFAVLYGSGLASLMAFAIGMTTVAAKQAFDAISPHTYPAANRSAAVGFLMGFGRGVSIVVPIAIGYVLQAGWSPTSVYQLFGVISLVAGMLVYMLHLSYRNRTEDPELALDEVQSGKLGVASKWAALPTDTQ